MKKLILLAAASLPLLSCTNDNDTTASSYEVWASDQSNSRAGVAARGEFGSYLWIWDSADIASQVGGGADAAPLGCTPGSLRGPCDLLEVFPQDLAEVGAGGVATGQTLSDLSGFGRLHGMLPDPQQRYLTANIFAPSGGFVGVIDRATKEAVGLFRVTGTNVGGADSRSVHMSFWSEDGGAIIVANLNGKVLERIDVSRDSKGVITDLAFNRSASLGVGKNMSVTAEATAFSGNNAFGRPLIGRISGDYADADFSDTTPNGVCKENGCGSIDPAAGGRPNNLIICPIPSDNGNVFITMGGGGLLVADHTTTPMTINGEYGNQIINGAGCGGTQVGDQMFLNAGVSASGAGADASTFTMYRLSDNAFGSTANAPNSPAPTLVFKDASNTATGGNVESLIASNTSGQLPGTTTRRDAHGTASTLDGRYVHNVDRIRNLVEVFDTQTLARTTYDLTSADGLGGGLGACAAKSVRDDALLPSNDPAPDLMERTPDGKYLMVALRGPAPVSVTHSAQGSCPGVGIIELTQGGALGRLIGVLRATNTLDTAPVSAPGGHAYSGAERSDPHAATVISTTPTQVAARF